MNISSLSLRRFQVGLALFFLILFGKAWGAVPETKPQSNSTEVKDRVYSRIAASAEALRTVSSDFSQEKHLAMLKNPLISEGRFVYEKPDRLFWEFRRPAPAGFQVQGTKVKRWRGSLRQAETIALEEDPPVKAMVEQIFAWSRADFPWLEKRYTIQVREETPTLLKLTPLSPQEKKFIGFIQIAFSPDWAYVRSVEIHEKRGDFTSIVFSGARVNQPIPEGLWEK
ncbi:MAG: outer membrane lipoprotein carrier protein LolA [Thermodesulfobacteriota bacterium]